MAFEVVQANEGEDYYDVSAYHSRGIAYRKLGQDAKADADEAKSVFPGQWGLLYRR